MGTTLIVKDADFSANAIDAFVKFPNVSNNTFSITSNSGGCVNLNDSSKSKRIMLSNLVNGSFKGIFVPNGKSIVLKGLKGNDGNHGALRFDYCYLSAPDIVTSTSAISSRNPYLVGTGSNFVSSNYFPFNTEGNDSATIVNSYGADYYFAFTTRNEANTAISAADYSNISFEII